MSKHIIIDITDKIGPDTLARELGVTLHSVRHARTTGLFPASWYGPLLGLCAERDIECPLEAFNWRSPSSSPESGVA
jgi:hypothetical protein